MRTALLPLAIFFSLLVTLQLNAAIVERDFLVPGDGLLIYDDENQREWLDLTYTLDADLATIQTQMEPGELLDGFKFATLNDVESFSLSAEVLWQDAERVLDPLAISPNLLPGPIVRPINSADEAKELFDLLGNVFTVEITESFVARPFFSVFGAFGLNDLSYDSSFSITDFFRYSFGQIADEIIDEAPRFNGTSVTVFSYDSASPTRGSLETQGISGGFGGIAMGLPEGFDGGPLVTGDQGPFWLFRTAAIPEPSSIVLLIIGAVVLFSQRRRC